MMKCPQWMPNKCSRKTAVKSFRPNIYLEEEAKRSKMIAIKGKVRTVGRMSKMFQTLRQESETLL